MKIGFIGLGKMGSRMAQKLLMERHNIVVWNRSKEAISNFKSQISNIKYTHSASSGQANKNLKVAKSIQDLVESLEKPRVIWLMVTAGEATQAVLDEISKFVKKDDIVIDGGNAYYKDTQKRYEDFRSNGIRYLGIGVSGGIIASEKGYPLMVGGDRSAYDYVRPILDSLSEPHGGHEYFGEGGAGHFVKMIHNGIEYGIMQSLGEGFDVLAHAPYKFDLLKVAKNWQKGTLVSSFMLDRVVEVLQQDPKLEKIVGVIGSASKESVWTVEQARKEGVPVEIIERSLEYRKRSQTDKKIQGSVTAKLVSGMRETFGGHEVKKK